MSKVLWGAVLGAAATVLFYKLNEQGAFDGVYEEANRFMSKTRNRVREAWEYTREEIEYLAAKARQEAEYFEEVARQKANQVADAIEGTGEKVADKIRTKAAKA
jgi:vacuolar-type H+-ATPase subunit H